MEWITSHSTLLMGLGVALLDFAFALVPSIKSNGIAHAIYLFLGGKKE